MVDVVIAMGSDSDLPIMKSAKELLDTFNISSQLRILSAHRTPFEMLGFASQARSEGVKVIIAGEIARWPCFTICPKRCRA